jgi:hypothetical protein
MTIHKGFQAFIILYISLFSWHCRTSKNNLKPQTDIQKLVETQPIKEKATPIIDHKSSTYLSKKMLDNQFNYKWLNSKFSATTNVDGKTNSFSASVRSRKDSALWISLSMFGIEGARLLATCDSVKFIDRINAKYFTGDYFYLSQILNTEIDFEMLQAVLIGNSVEFYGEDDKLRTYIENGNQVLSTIRKRKIKKVINNTISEQNILKELVQRIWLDASTYRVRKNVINDFNTNRTFEGSYSNFQLVDSLLFPFEVEFSIQAQRTMKVSINYSKVEINNVQSLPFSIPAKYESMKQN